MSFKYLQKVIVLTAVILLPYVASASDQERVITLLLIGDSTVADYSKLHKPDIKLVGWGQVLSEVLKGKTVILNYAKPGASSKSFIERGFWGKAKQMKADYLLIQFGHNDLPSKGDRSTDSETDFPMYLNEFIQHARLKGIKPILITPVARRSYRNGKIYTQLTPYAHAMIKIGKEKNVPVIDLHKKSIELFNRAGQENSHKFGPDRTHFSKQGAIAIAEIIAKELYILIPKLMRH
jgi:lysophospholipase L1-like esterase